MRGIKSDVYYTRFRLGIDARSTWQTVFSPPPTWVSTILSSWKWSLCNRSHRTLGTYHRLCNLSLMRILQKSSEILHSFPKQSTDPFLTREALPTRRFGHLSHLGPWIPIASRHWWSSRKNMLIIQQTLAAMVFSLNVGLTSWASAKHKTSGGIGTLHMGDCATVKRINLWSHLAINILSTLLLGSSNYCMQLLVAPTRFEVQEAHTNSVWLDIGIPSVKNLRWVSWKSVLTWCSLGLSSAFLHLL